ncbi:MAG: propionyl-CoA synthetase [Acidimicrobiia bacterium]|nr:propionyl-CoA synthetase [Acidimicrobiia bacterium]
MSYARTYEASQRDSSAFWARAAEDIDWFIPYEIVLDDTRRPFYRWFSGGVMNTCYNALDRHVIRGRADQAALIYDSPMTGQIQTVTYAELLERVARFAGALRRLGVEKGDRVVIYMPMVPEAVVAMLACARIGAIHSVVFGGFASKELATRIDDAKPAVIVTASCGLEPGRTVAYKPLLDDALEIATHQPVACVIFQRPELEATLVAGRDVTWAEAIAGADPTECVAVLATDPLYILYTSGTTGVPKGVVRDNGGHAVALKWSMQNFYGVDPGDTFWAASDVGWVVGHSYIVYGPLLHGCTTVLFEGKPVGTPDPGTFWRVIDNHRVKVLFTAPTAFRAIKRDDPTGSYLSGHDISSLAALFLAGERCDPDTLSWAADKLGVPVLDHWWQTETGWPVAGNPLGLGLLAVKPGSAGVPVPGYRVDVVDDEGTIVPAGDIGSVVIRLPMPPGTLPTLWNNEDGYEASYLARYPGYYLTGDAGFKDADGYLSIMSRIDDIINVAGHRLSTGAMEEILSDHPDVAECAVIGVTDDLKGQVPVGFVVLKTGVARDHSEIVAELIASVRARIGPVASFKHASVVARLPKTRSGKILRSTMRKMADAEEWSVPATIDDPAILDEIGEALEAIGYPRGQ